MVAVTQRCPEDWATRLNETVAGKLEGVDRKALHLVSVQAAASLARTSVTFDAPSAEKVVRKGLKASAVQDVAEILLVQPRDLLEYMGLDRTTVQRRARRNETLPMEASVKVMQFVELAAAAADVFGGVDPAMSWLTTPHPMIESETPLQRARTPWGMRNVLGILNALKYGGAA